MSYEINMRNEEGYVRVDLGGSRARMTDFAKAQETLSSIPAFCKAHGQPNILLIVNLTGSGNRTYAYELVSQADKIGWDASLRIALLDKDSSAADHNAFIQLAASNRGLNIRLLNQEDLAIN